MAGDVVDFANDLRDEEIDSLIRNRERPKLIVGTVPDGVKVARIQLVVEGVDGRCRVLPRGVDAASGGAHGAVTHTYEPKCQSPSEPL